jgi:nucleoside-diphosphate-sugar epimerase
MEYFGWETPFGRVSRRICDPTKAKRDLKFVAKVKLEDGLKEFLKWYKEASQK